VSLKVSKNFTQCGMISQRGQVARRTRRGAWVERLAAVLLWLGLALVGPGCLSNPTPHPEGPDGGFSKEDEIAMETTSPNGDDLDHDGAGGDALEPAVGGPDGGDAWATDHEDGGGDGFGGDETDGGDAGPTLPTGCQDGDWLEEG